jgi:hypothetical protein
MACYRKGGCGPYEMYSCSECPASKPEYAMNGEKVYVAMLNGEIKDNYMSIAFSEKSAKEKLINTYFNEKGHTESDLDKLGIYITIVSFDKKNSVSIF